MDIKLDGYINGKLFKDKYLVSNYAKGVSVKVASTKDGKPILDKDGNYKYGKEKFPYGNLKGCIQHIVRRESNLYNQLNEYDKGEHIENYKLILNSIESLMQYVEDICEDCNIQNKKIGE